MYILETSTNLLINSKPSIKKPIFRLNTLVDCDLSVLDDSSFLSNLSQAKQPSSINGVIPDILSCSTAKKTSISKFSD